MKSAMPYLGIPSPARQQLWRELLPAFPLSSLEEWQEVALELWREARYREEWYATIAITDAKRYASYRTWQAMPMLEEMIVSGAWWDVVDALATHHLGDVLAHERTTGRADRMHALLLRWARGKDKWKRRAAILCQIRFKQQTDLALLYACIEPNLLDGPPRSGEIQRDFFIRKAIGWALRQYAWIDPVEVTRYVSENRERLSPLSIREATRNTDRRGSGGRRHAAVAP